MLTQKIVLPIYIPLPSSGDLSDCGGYIYRDSGSLQYPVGGGNYPRNADCSWIIVSSGTSIELHFLQFRTEANRDYVSIRDGENNNSPLLFWDSGTSLPSKVIRTTTNKGFIRFTSNSYSSDLGFALGWSTLDKPCECSGTYSAESGTICLPISSTGNYRNYLNCTWIINSAAPLDIFFSSFSTEKSNDILTIRDGNISESTQLGIFSGNKLPEPLRTMRGAYLQFISDRNRANTGFVLHWNISSSGASRECGKHINSNSGSIQYPISGGHYHDEANCSWIIVSSGSSIELKFTRFSTEFGIDNVYMRNGESSSAPELGKYSGVTLPPSVRTTGNKVFISFISDYVSTSTGFSLTWNTIDEKCTCGGNYSTDSGTICLPITSYGKYMDNMNCTWIINSAVPLDISFSSFNTKSGKDILTIRNGSSSESVLIGNFSGNALPETLKMKTKDAYIQFTSNVRTVGNGFVLHWNISHPGSTTSNTNSSTESSTYITIGAVIAVLVIVVLITSVLIWLKKKKDKDLPQHQSDLGMGNRHDSENSLYGATPGTTELAAK
ncbi:unnamed protein product, partial [Meganyctiphanes norvegica]